MPIEMPLHPLFVAPLLPNSTATQPKPLSFFSPLPHPPLSPSPSASRRRRPRVITPSLSSSKPSSEPSASKSPPPSPPTSTSITPPTSPSVPTSSTNSDTSPTTTPTVSSSSSSTPSLPLSLALLNFVTVLWGTQHPIIKYVISDPSSSSISPSLLNLLRFSLAASISSLPLLLTSSTPLKLNPRTLRNGLELSLYMFAGYALQSVALLTTTASRSAFLLYLNVKLVPLFASVLYKRRISPLVWASAATALLGTALLTCDANTGTAIDAMNPNSHVIGDVLSIVAAAFSALFILRTEAATQNDEECDPVLLNAVTLGGVTAFSALWALGDFVLHNVTANDSQLGWTLLNFDFDFQFSPTAIAAVVYLGVVTTALCNYVQAVGQKGVSAQRAAVVFALDPVYGALFAWLLLGEQLGGQGMLGAAFIVAAAIGSALVREDGDENKNENENGAKIDVK